MKGSPQLALDRLDPRRITFAREVQALTKKQLAERIEKTPSAVTQFEQGTLHPDLETFRAHRHRLERPSVLFCSESAC